MDKISVKMSDVSLRGTEGVKSTGQTKDITGDFKKLLQDQSDNSSKDVSKDTKTEKNTDSVKEQKKEEPKKTDDTKEEVKEVKETEVEDVQTNGLLAAYQMAQNFRPEVIQAEPEMVAGEVVQEETQVIPEMELASDMAAVQTADPQMAESVQVQPEMVVEAVQTQPRQKEAAAAEVKPQAEQPVQEIHAEKVRVPEAAQVQQKTDTSGGHASGKRQDAAQHEENHFAEQAVQVQNPETHTEVQAQDMKLQEPVRMQVPQPEELPEKVTDQLMAKISEGVQEFEIHIEPVNLGKIAVKILYQEGQATVSIMCSEKRAFDVLGRNAGEIGQIIDKNLGGTTTIVVDKQESDYLNQTRDENQQNGQNGEREQQKGEKKEQDADNAQDFLQRLRLGLAG